ncbi:MAG: hypothetical protein J6F33_12985, partial [Acidaminococcaceae bacterium]|nr:hypothetical protein [Acidaminococcaceae bacterium]
KEMLILRYLVVKFHTETNGFAIKKYKWQRTWGSALVPCEKLTVACCVRNFLLFHKCCSGSQSNIFKSQNAREPVCRAERMPETIDRRFA